MIDSRHVIRLCNQVMDALMEDWEIGLAAVPGPLAGMLPGSLRPKAERDELLNDLLQNANVVVLDELRSWWVASDHYHPLVIQEYGGCADELREILALKSAEKQKQRIRGDELFQGWGLAVRLLEASVAERFSDPHRTADLARAALLTAQLLDPQRYEPRWLHDLEARCWAHVGNARRFLGEFRAAADAFRCARELLESGSGRGLPWARVKSLEASLLTDQGHFDFAQETLRRVIAIYEGLDFFHEAGHARVKLSKLLYEAGHEGSAIEALRKAVTQVDASRSARLNAVAHLNLAVYLLESGDVDASAALLREYPAPAEPLLLQKFMWVKAKVDEYRGRFESASELLSQLRALYLQQELGFDAALVSLDLAAVYLQMGEPAKVRRLAEEVYPLFMAEGVEREALAALLVFRKAASEEAVTLGLVRELSGYLKRLQK